jgi:hypothetical protein
MRELLKSESKLEFEKVKADFACGKHQNDEVKTVFVCGKHQN